ncbi:MAG TPA: amidohydrolase family protein [Longimicrobiales bacterium]
MIVDFHNHYYPDAYLLELERGESNARLERDREGRMLLHYPGDYNVVVSGHRDLDERIAMMDRAGVDVQVISLTTPGVHIEQRARGIELARLVNDEFAAAAKRYDGRFVPLASLPLQDPAAAVVELERAVGLGHRGALLFSNINGRTLDEEEFFPLFQRLAELDLPAFIHPTNPATLGALEEYRLTALLGFLFDTTTAVTRLILAGMLEQLPELKLVVGHLGGTIPFTAERVDRGFEVYPELHERLTRPPAEYFQRLYLDTVNFDPAVLRLGLEFAGADHLVFGSDYPHQVGYVDRALDGVNALPLGTGERQQVLGGNAAALLKL